MLTLDYKHRLGNCLLQYCAAYLMAEKHDLLFKVDASNTKNTHVAANWGKYFNIIPPTGDKIYDTTLTVSIKNYNQIYHKEKIETNLHLNCYFQHKSIFVNNADRIKKIFNLTYEEVDPSDVFVMYRIGDLEGKREMVPKEYYEEVLTLINTKKGYISSDSPNHPYILDLQNKFNLTLYNENTLNTLNFAKNFNNIVVGEGTFHWWAAFFSKAKNIYYNKRNWSWFGKSIYEFPDWKYCSWDWCNSVSEINKEIINFKPVKI